MIPAENELRYERKFIIPSTENFWAKHFLYTNQLRFYRHFEQRRINSIYLDYPEYKFLHDNLDGLPFRKKFRIRWYGDGDEITMPKLEIKHKCNNLGYKEFYPLDKFNLKNTKCIMKNLEISLMKNNYQNSLIKELKLTNPTIFVSYIRSYFKSKIIDCRITIDEKIYFEKLNAKSKFNLKNHKIIKTTIMEIKYPMNINKNYLYSFLKIPFSLSKNSKYASGLSNFLNF